MLTAGHDGKSGPLCCFAAMAFTAFARVAGAVFEQRTYFLIAGPMGEAHSLLCGLDRFLIRRKQLIWETCREGES